MRLISLNVEGLRHHEKIEKLFHQEQAEVVCLQEAHIGYADVLQNMGYNTIFLPRCHKEQDGNSYTDGELFASKHPMTTRELYYYKSGDKVPTEVYDASTERKASWQGAIIGEVALESKTFHIATTHFTWSPDGSTASEAQTKDMAKLIEMMENEPPHIMCGDFNIPRHHNPLYEELIKLYRDEIPTHYQSSLDKELHYVGHDPEKQILFTSYMVDYVFSQPPYSVSDVKLSFGYSDHAAITCIIERND